MKTLAILGYFNDEVAQFVNQIRRKTGLNDSEGLDIPHITFAITGDLPIEKAQTSIRKFLENNNLLLLEFSSFGYFTDSGVLFLGITPTIELFHFHRGLIKFITDDGHRISPYYMPGKWVPHCSVASKKSLDLSWCSEIDDISFPFPARIEKLSVTELDHSIGEMTHRIDFGQMTDPDDTL
jgi:2'-5' RNA ligase